MRLELESETESEREMVKTCDREGIVARQNKRERQVDRKR